MLNFLYTIIIYPLVQIIEIAYLVVWKVFKNSGFAVIGVSVAVTLLCLPLYIIAERWQEKERETQKKLKPGVDRIKKAFKGDEQYMILSTFYKQNHYHPLMALRSSISLLIQIPFFIAAYTYLSNLEELQGFRFYFIRDLGAPDALFSIGNFKVNVLPIAMTAINCIAGAIYTKGFSLKEKLQIYGMAGIFLVLLYNSPAGLVLYWTMNNVFSLVKNIFYKLKNPLKVLYICLCAGVFAMDYYLLFVHHGFLHRRLMLIFAVTLILLAPLLVKFINFLLNTVFKPLTQNTKLCSLIFFSSAAVLLVLMGFVLPSFVIASSPQEFSFIDSYKSPFYFLRNSLFQATGFFVFWPACIYFLFGKRVKTIISVVFSVFAFSALINAFIFPGNYGMLSPILMFSDAGVLKSPAKTNIINFLVLLLPVVFVFVANIFNRQKIVSSLTAISCFALIVVSVANSVKISSEYKKAAEQKQTAQTKKTVVSPVFNLSKEHKNVFVIMLDRAISGYFPTVIEEKPELMKIFEGFIYYPNTVSYADHTLIGAPPLFGGYEYSPVEINRRNSESLKDKHNEALISIPLLFSQNGFDVTVSDLSWANYSWISDMRIFNPYPKIKTPSTIRTYTDIWLQQHPESSSKGVRGTLMKRNFIWYSLLKCMPTVFRDTVYNDGFYWNTNKSLEDLQDVVNNYAALDYLPELTEITSENGTYTCIVNEMTHEPAFLQAPNYIPLAKVTDKGSGPYAEDVHYHANIGALLRIGEWLEYLKENGVYDNTRIIIVADHGAAVTTSLFPPPPQCDNIPFRKEAFNPLLLVKDFDAAGTLKTDNSFMTNADMPTLATKDIIADPKNPFTGKEINSKAKENGVVLANSPLWSPDAQYKNTFKVFDDEWFFVKDNIFENKNWSRISKEQITEAD